MLIFSALSRFFRFDQLACRLFPNPFDVRSKLFILPQRINCIQTCGKLLVCKEGMYLFMTRDA